MKPNPPWLIGLANVTFNGNGLFAAIPFLLRREGLEVPEIAAISTLLLIPSFSFFLWTPIVELWISRRQWWILLYSLTALLQFAGLLQPLPRHLVSFEVLLFLANVTMFGTYGILGPLVRDTIEEPRRGQAAGWIYAAQMISAGGAGLIIWIAEHGSRLALAASVAAMGMVPVVAMLFVREPVRAADVPLLRQLRNIGVDLKAGFGLRTIREGMLILVSPMSAAALTYLFSGVAVDYHVSGQTTALLGGIGWTLAGAIGAVLGGRIASRIGAYKAYPVAGITTGICAIAMWIAGVSAGTFTVGSMVYVTLGGFCGAAAVSLIIELSSGAGHAASIWFAALWSAGNLPWTYMQWVDGQGYKRFGPAGMLAFDATANLIPPALLLLYLHRTRVRRIGM